MRQLFVLILFVCAIAPLNAETELQRQTENAQNHLEWTINRVAHAWGKMKFHFGEGNKRMKDSTGVDGKTIKKNLEKIRIE